MGNNKGKIDLIFIITSLCFILLFPFQKMIQAEIRNDHFIAATGTGMEIGFNQYPILAKPDKKNSEELGIYQRRIERLEKNVKALSTLNQSMLEEIRRLNRVVEKRLVKKSHIDKVNRTGGRPNEKDGAVDVAGLVALWHQMDILMAKLDEIVAKFSQ